MVKVSAGTGQRVLSYLRSAVLFVLLFTQEKMIVYSRITSHPALRMHDAKPVNTEAPWNPSQDQKQETSSNTLVVLAVSYTHLTLPTKRIV